MTVTAMFSVRGLAVALGDLLLSGPEREEEAALPVIGGVTEVFPKGSGWSITGLRQKIALVSPRCIVLWSGSEIQAAVVVRELREIDSSTPITLALLHGYLDRNRSHIEELQLMGYVVEDERAVPFTFPALPVNSAPPLESLQLGGSGAKSLLSLLQSLPSARRNSGRSVADFAIASALYVTGSMLEAELVQRKNLTEYFGGGWETAYFNSGRFVKLAEVTHCFWYLQILGGLPALGSPQLVIKQDYLDELLRMRVARRVTGRYQQELYGVTPVAFSQKKARARARLMQGGLPDFNSKWMVHHVILLSGKQVASFTRVETTAPGVIPAVKVLENKLGLFFQVNKEFEREVLQALGEALNSKFKAGN